MRSLPTRTPYPSRRSRPTRPTRFAAPALALGAAVILAACGSSGSSATSSTTKAAASSSGPTSAAVVVRTASNPQLGTILVDKDGMTLYTLTNNGQAVACTGGCRTAWPPLLLPAGSATATGGSGVTGLAVVATADGRQVTEKGLPLYRFAADSTAGETKGDGINSFGGTWHAVKVSGAAASNGNSTSTTTATTTTTTGRAGY